MSHDPSASPAESSREPKTVRVALKSSGKTRYCQLAEKSTVGELRSVASRHFSVNKGQVLLIFAGKTLKDQETLLQHDIQDGDLVHVVVERPEPRHSPAPQAQPAAPGCSAAGRAAGVPGSSGGATLQPLLRSIRGDLVTLLDLFCELPQHFRHHPELMFQVVGSSTVQRLLSDERNPLTVAFVLGVSSLVSLRVVQSRAEKEKALGDREVAEVLGEAFVQNLLANTKEMAQFVSESPQLKAFAQETPQFGRLLSLSGLTKLMVVYKKLPRLADSVTPGVSLEADVLDDLESFRQLFADLRQVLSSPEVQDELEDRMLRRTLETSPSLIQLAQENLTVGHMLRNPRIVGEIIKYIRKPEVKQEMDRHCDRILSNMESFPGGYNILQRMYKEMEEPLWSAMEEQRENPFATRPASPASTRSPGLENRDPLPDPWVPRQPPTGPRGTGQASRPRGAAEEGSLLPPKKAPKGARVDVGLESGQAEAGLLPPEASKASPETPASSLRGGEAAATEPPSSQAPGAQSPDLQGQPGQANAGPGEGLGARETEGNPETSTEAPPGSPPP